VGVAEHLPVRPARIAAVRDHHLSVPWSDALRSRWSLLADYAADTGHDDVAGHARDVLERLEQRVGD
jgi:hypothetical protein